MSTSTQNGTNYGTGFYTSQASGSSGSASQIVPIICKLIKPASVLDVGCGIGTWLAEFRNNGVTDVIGVDGDYVNRSQLLIEPDRFKPADLTKPVALGRSFDLAMSLEVGEHLPAASAAAFVDSITAHAQVVVFSAAIPEQGGTAHINEQWQHYWAELFEARGYLTIDSIRRHVWSNPKVESFYSQNILMYARPGVVEQNPVLKAEYERTSREMLSVVHPASWMFKSSPLNVQTRTLLSILPGKIVDGIRYRFKRRFQPGSLPHSEYLLPSKF